MDEREYERLHNYTKFKIVEMLIDKYKDDSDFKLVVEALLSSLDDDCEETYKKNIDFCQRLSDHRKFQFKDIWKNIPL